MNQISRTKVQISVVKRFKLVGSALLLASISTATWAACSGALLDVGYDFNFGAKTGLAALDAGTCVPGATTVALAGDDYCSGAGGVGDYVIRTNDGGVATLKYTFNTGTVHDNYTIVIDIPQTGAPGSTFTPTATRLAGQDVATWSGLPSSCSGPGSAITNGGRTLTCNLGTIDATGGQITVAVPASFKVSTRALNGETFALQSNVSSSGGSAGACAAQPTPTAAQALTVSARPKIDIKTSIYNYSPASYGGVPGYYMDFYIYIDGLNNATVGGEAVAAPLNFNVGLGSTIPTAGVKYLGMLDYWENTTLLTSTNPVGSPAGNGATIPVTLSPDSTRPTCAAEFLVPGGGCVWDPIGVPQRLSWQAIRYFVPLTDFPNPAGQIDFNNFINSNGSNGPASILTPPASGAGTFSEPIASNNAPYTAIKTLPGTYAKYIEDFVVYNGTVRPPGSPASYTSMSGEVGGVQWCVGGSCKQYPTKTVETMIDVGNRSPSQWTNTIICDKFDNHGQVLTRRARVAGYPTALYPSNMPGDVIMAMADSNTNAATIPAGFTVEVATSPITPVGYPSNAQKCGDLDAPWVDANTVTDYTPYNLVRINVPVFESVFTVGSTGFMRSVFQFTVPLSAPNGAYIGNQMMIRTDTEKLGGALPGDWNTSTYNPITNAGVYIGERFQVVKALVRTQKDALDKFGNSTTILGAGKTVTFKLSPSYTAAPGVPAPNATIDVVDVLPIPLTYVPGTARSGSPSVVFEPNSIVVNATGQQVLTWSLPNVVLNSGIPPIYIDVFAPLTTPSGTILTNVVTVASPLIDQSTDAERSASKAVTIDNVAGFFVTKKVSAPLIPRNGTYTYTLEVANLKVTAESNIDIIDVLPRVANVVTPPSAFSGNRFLTGPVTGAGATVYYTNAAVGAAPTALNSTIGGAVGTAVAGDFAIAPLVVNGWCLFADIGVTPGCPANLAAVTGIRALVPTIAGNGLAQITLPMGTSGNVENDIYTNRFAMAATGFGPLFSNDVVTTVKQAKLSGKVFLDTNLDSQITAGEPPIAGVQIVLCNVGTPIPCPAANVVATTTTSVTGDYQFTDLYAGTYYVREVQPTQYSSSGANVPGTAGGMVPSPDAFDAITLVPGQSATNYNFGERASVLSGHVCEDLNNDGICQAGEPPIAGVTITLTGTDAAGNAVTRTAVTSATGTWVINDVPTPNATGYTLEETQPIAYLDGKQAPGVLTPYTGPDLGASVGTTTATDTTTPAKDKITGIKFTTATSGVSFDFAEVKPASLQGFVYLDVAQNGVRDAGIDPGLVGVTLELTGTTDMGVPVSLTTTATIGPDGSYTFANLRPGTYTVREIQPITPTFSVADGTVTIGTIAYTTPQTATPGTLITETPSTLSGAGEGVQGINLGSGGVGTGYNFGEVPLVPISGTVFVDKNYDGLLSAGETGLPASGTTTLTLCRTNNSPCPPADVVATTVTTPGSGTYTFQPVAPGSYFVVETQPTGFASSSINSQPVTVVATPITGINFAETGATLSGTVYADINANGVFDGVDAGITGVKVQLCTTPTCVAGTEVAFTNTSPGGTYSFANLPAGPTYYIKEDQTTVPASYVNATTTIGALVAGGTGGSSTPGTTDTPNSTQLGVSFTMPTSVVTGAAPVVGTNYNFGELPVAGISGSVYYDRNGDGVLTPGETGVSKTTTVVLCRVALVPCPVTDIQASTTTDTSGNYVFAGVPAGAYFIQETQPVGYGSSTANAIPVTMAGVAIANQNFGETLATVSGTVYRDNDASGTLNAGDTGLANVTVRLCTTPACGPTDGPNGGAPLVVNTSVAGTYTFSDLPAPPTGGQYYIVEDQTTVATNYPTLVNATTTAGTFTAAAGATGVTSGTSDTPNNRVSAIAWVPGVAPSLSPAGTGTGYNFGELPTSSISGSVILDSNFDGVKNGTETGLPNAATTTLTLCRTNNSPCPPTDTVATTVTTPSSGTYTFGGITPGSYFVVETQPTGYASSSPNALPVSVAGITPVTGVDFAETGASLSGTVYKDVDYSGTNNIGDIPLLGVVVRLCTTNNCAAGSVVATATTTIAGLYQFTNLPAPPTGQQYFIVENQATVPPTPTTLADGTTSVGAFVVAGTGGSAAVGTAVQASSRIDGISWVPPTSVVTGTPVIVGTNFNFGEIDGVDVGGKVFFDSNRNGLVDGPLDTPLTGVAITLCRVATVPCPAVQVVGTTTTSVTGDYLFPKVPPGSYFVQETQPSGYGSAVTSPDVRPITVASVNLVGINFADTLSSIAGLVYRDDNGSQTRDGAEPTMPGGITITLTGVDATGAPVTRTTVTTAAGTYLFDNLKTGTYTITESQPASFGTGGSNPGTLAGGSGGANGNTITAIVLAANTDAPNYNFGDVPMTAGVAGAIWRDNNHDNMRQPDEPVLPGWTVQVLRTPLGGGTPTLVASAVTDANGAYSIAGLEAGGGYSLRFIAPGGAIFGGAVDGEQGAPVSGATVSRGEISSLTLTASVTGGPNIIPQQSLPVDPSGVIYDADTRLPVPGAQVRFEAVNCPAFNPAVDLVGGVANQTQTVGADGFYQFLLNPGAPACQYRLVVIPPGGYVADSATPSQAGPFTPLNRPPNSVLPIVPNATAPQGADPTTYYLTFNLNANSQDVVNNHIPLVSRNRPVLFITKVANKAKAELGDTVRYTVRVRYASGAVILPSLKVVDTMPVGFKLIPDTSFVSVPTGAPPVLLTAANIVGAPGAVVTYNIPLPSTGFAPGSEIELTYRVRVAVGSMQGDGINRAQARAIGTIRSNIAQAKVIVDPGVFTSEGCVAGKVFVDCNNNHIQDTEELGIPGVRLYMEDGTYFVTDSEGKYSYCGLSPKSHAVTVDMLTMPRGARLTTTSNRNLGDGNSMFLDVKNGQLIRADFAEGSCSNTVLEQVKARRTQGEVRSVETEKTGQPALKWEGKSPQYPQQGTEGANQPLVMPRTNNAGSPSVSEQNTPTAQMPRSSSNTQGANVRNAK